jgi:hypothetical protein
MRWGDNGSVGGPRPGGGGQRLMKEQDRGGSSSSKGISCEGARGERGAGRVSGERRLGYGKKECERSARNLRDLKHKSTERWRGLRICGRTGAYLVVLDSMQAENVCGRLTEPCLSVCSSWNLN